MKLLALLLVAAAVGLGQYDTFAVAERRLAEVARQNPGVVTLDTIGSSAGGRRIYALRIAGPGRVTPEARPAIFVGANLVGYHNAGTQAALALVDKLVTNKGSELLSTRTFYVLPMLNPDAHDSYFAKVKWRNSLNGAKLDRDRDGLVGEDGPNDLNGDGRITQMRIADPNGVYAPLQTDARVMKAVDPLKGERGSFRLLTEGIDDDRDGAYNEDALGGYRPDKNFAHAWSDDDPEAGPFPGSEPETRAVMDYVLARRNIALAFVFGPANNLLTMPRGTGPSLEVGQTRVTPQPQLAQAFGIEARAYTVDEIFPLVQQSPLARQMAGEVTKEAVASLFGAGPATAPAAEDVRYYEALAGDYKKGLAQAGLESKRSGQQSAAGGLQNWLYYHYGGMAVELDVWGVPGEAMTYVDQQKQGFVPWTPITLPDGTKVEVGGLDPFVEIAPPAAELAKAVAAHADFVETAATKLATVQILSSAVEELSPGVWRVKATAGNTGYLPTHTQHAVRTRTWLPVRLTLGLAAGATLVSGKTQAARERLTGGTGQLTGEWLVKAARGTKLGLTLESQNAGSDRREITLQ